MYSRLRRVLFVAEAARLGDVLPLHIPERNGSVPDIHAHLDREDQARTVEREAGAGSRDRRAIRA